MKRAYYQNLEVDSRILLDSSQEGLRVHQNQAIYRQVLLRLLVLIYLVLIQKEYYSRCLDFLIASLKNLSTVVSKK